MKWQFSGLGAGVYVFGAAPLTNMPSDLGRAPFIHVQENNEGEPFLASVTKTGFEIVDRGTGPAPVVTVTIIER